jgi:hypothetical protein
MSGQSNPPVVDFTDPEFPYPRDRDKDVADRPLSPESLVGSYFRAPDPHDPNAEALWLDGQACMTIEGIVVAQPFASSTHVVYLVEFYGRHGMSGWQMLIDIDRMLEQRWSFFDTEAWLQARPPEDRREEVITNEPEPGHLDAD